MRGRAALLGQLVQLLIGDAEDQRVRRDFLQATYRHDKPRRRKGTKAFLHTKKRRKIAQASRRRNRR